jgi:hypothetical protein
MVQQPVWISDDGKEFDSENAMLAHEAGLKFIGLTDAYLQELEPRLAGKHDPVRLKSALTRAENAILPFLHWMDHAGYLSPACLAAAQQMLAEHNAQAA